VYEHGSFPIRSIWRRFRSESECWPLLSAQASGGGEKGGDGDKGEAAWFNAGMLRGGVIISKSGGEKNCESGSSTVVHWRAYQNRVE